MGEPIRPAKHDHATGSRYPEGLAILKTYDGRYKFGASGLADFIRVAEEIGGRQVDEMFEAWFYREQVPDIPELSLSMGN